MMNTPSQLSSDRRKVRQLLLTAALGGALIAMPQVAKAATHTLSGAQTTPQSVTTDTDPTVTVNTAAGYSVTIAAGDALTISGSGDISYIDTNNAPLSTTDTNGIGLHIVNNGDNGETPGSITINTGGTISGGNFGIATYNGGSGDTNITTGGVVTGTNNSGIYADNEGTGSVIINANNDVHGGINGIHVENGGTANNITVNTAVDTTVNGTQAGIITNNQGTGATSITANGAVSGGNYGINATNGVNTTGDLTINTGASEVQGDTFGIVTSNSGTGNTSITTGTGEIASTTNSGIRALNGVTAGDLHITTNGLVSGGNHGIDVENDGIGDTEVTANADVTGNAANGINVVNSATTTGLEVTTAAASTVTGTQHGISTSNQGTGATTITANGTITAGAGYNGISAVNGATAGELSVTTGVHDVSGGAYGIATSNSGTGITSITTGGVVEGSTMGIHADSPNGAAISISINDGSEVRNSSLSSADLALATSNGAATVTNAGTVTGSIQLGGGYTNIFNNNNTWNAANGESSFGDDGTLSNNDTLNNTDDFLAARTTGISTTGISGLATVNNTGDIVMQNTDERIGGGTAYVGDTTAFVDGGAGEFVSGGNLYIDTSVADGTSDELIVDNVERGEDPTTVHVNIVGALGAPTTGDGIEVVAVGGLSANNAFVLNAPITAGLYNYDLNQGQVDTQSWFLQSDVRPEAVATGVLPILGSRTALATLSNLDDRQRDENVLSNDQNSTKGVWARTFGQNDKFNSNDANGFGFDTTLWGAQAGIDFMAHSDGTGNRKYAGLYVAYASSSGDALQQGTKVGSVDLNATTLGAYYTKYSRKGWYLDAVAQYSWLGGIQAKTATDEVNPGGSSYAASLEVGQQFNPDSNIIREVQAQLIDQYTNINDVTLGDETHIGISGLNAVTGRFGIRLYQNPKTGKKFLPWVRANLWNTFSGNSSISSLGSTITTPIGGTSGELQAGFTMGPGSGGKWNIYAAGGYLFDISGAQYSGWEGTLGIRKGW